MLVALLVPVGDAPVGFLEPRSALSACGSETWASLLVVTQVNRRRVEPVPELNLLAVEVVNWLAFMLADAL